MPLRAHNDTGAAAGPEPGATAPVTLGGMFSHHDCGSPSIFPRLSITITLGA